MRILFYKVLQQFNSITQRVQLHKYVCKMDKAYLRHKTENETEHFEFTFRYTNPDLKVDRLFNFCRRLSEPVSSFLERVNANVEKVLNKKKKKKSNDEVLLSISAKLLINNKQVNEEIPCSEVFGTDNDLTLKVLEKEFKIIINSPWIQAITLPKSILANFPVYPSKFETVYTNKKLSSFTWYKSTNKRTWDETGSGFMYTPKNEDINYFLKLLCIPKNETKEGPTIEVVSEVCVQASPGECPFDLRHEFTKEKASGKE